MLVCHDQKGPSHFPAEESQLPVSPGETHPTEKSSPRPNAGRLATRKQAFRVLRLRQNRIESHQRICVFSVAFLEGLFVRLNFSKSGDQGEEDTAERWGVSCSSSLCWGSRTRAGGKQGPQLPGLTVLYATKFLATALGQGERTASG